MDRIKIKGPARAWGGVSARRSRFFRSDKHYARQWRSRTARIGLVIVITLPVNIVKHLRISALLSSGDWELGRLSSRVRRSDYWLCRRSRRVVRCSARDLWPSSDGDCC